MIGGIDVHMASKAGDSSVEVAVRAIVRIWRDAVFENAGERYDFFSKIPFGEVEEIFVYRDAASADAWDMSGAIPEVYNTMIHVIPDEGMITVVVDERDSAMDNILAEIFSGLSDDTGRNSDTRDASDGVANFSRHGD